MHQKIYLRQSINPNKSQMKKSLSLNLKLVLSLAIILLASGCSKKAADIKISDLEEPCDFMEAYGAIIDEIGSIVGDSDFDDLSKAEQKEIEELMSDEKEGYRCG
jgi:hypothetical protein